MKVAVAGELLADQCGADDLAISLDQAAIRLPGEQCLGDTGHGQGVGEAGDQHEPHENDNRRTKLFQHGASPQTRCSVVTTTSITLMPTNGMRIPPRP